MSDVADLEERGAWADAAQRYRTLLDGTSDRETRVELHLRLAECLMKDGDPDEAEHALADAEREVANQPLSDRLMASIAEAQGALAEYQGHLRSMRERYEVSRQYLSQTDGSLLEIDLKLARSDIRLGDIAAAVERLSAVGAGQSLSVDQRAQWLDVIGLMLLARGEAFAAMQVLELAVKLDDQADDCYEASESRLLLARACLRSGNRRRARKLLQEAMETYEELRNPRDLSEALALQGLYFEESGRYKEATVCYRKGFDQDILSDDPVGHAQALRSLGRIYLKRGIDEQAREYFEQARNRLVGVDDRIETLKLTCDEAELILAENDYDRAIAHFEDALRQAELIGDARRIAIVKRGLAGAIREDGDVSRSLELLREAHEALLGTAADDLEDAIDQLLVLAGVRPIERAERGDLRELEELLDDLGEALLEGGQYEEALEVLSESRRLDEFLETPTECQARSLILLGRAYSRLGRRREARRNFDDALRLYEDGEDEVGQSEAWYQLGRWYVEEGRLRDALKQFRKALSIDQHMDDHVNVARALRSIAAVYRRMGDLNRASEQIDDAREALSVDDPAERAELELEAARIAIRVGDEPVATAALSVARENSEGNAVGIAMCDHVEAQLAVIERNFQRALRLLDQARVTFERKGDIPELDDLWDDIGEVRLLGGDVEGAREAIMESLELGKRMGWDSGRGRSLLLLARSAIGVDRRLARQHIDEALAAFENDEVGTSETKSMLAEWYEREGDLKKAVIELKESRRLYQDHGDLRGLAECNRRLAKLYVKRSDWVRAEEAFEQAEEQLTLAKANRELALMQVDFGEFWQLRGNPREAVKRFEQALPVIEGTAGNHRELARLHDRLIQALQSSGELGAALLLMRRADAERSSVWHAVVWDLHPEIELAAEESYGRGNYQEAITAAYRVVEERLREVVPGGVSDGKHVPATELAKRFAGELEPLRDLILAGYRFIRNPLSHGQSDLTGIDALAGLLIAHLILSALTSVPSAGNIASLAVRRQGGDETEPVQ